MPSLSGADSFGAGSALTPARLRADLSTPALYLRYIGLGGLASPVEVADHCGGGPPLPAPEHNVLVQALNERFLEVGDSERLPFM